MKVSIHFQSQADFNPKLILNCSEQLRDAHEVRLLQIFEAWERLVEILRQEKHLLRDLNNLFLFTTGHLDKFLHDHVGNQGVLLKLLAYFECNV